MTKCPHIKDCNQQIASDSLPLCRGLNVFPHDYDKCFKWGSLDVEGKFRDTPVKTPKAWDVVL